MKGFTVTTEKLNALHRKTKNKRVADRVKAVYSLAVGHNIAEVASILMIDEETLRNYRDQYKEGGILALLKDNYKGSICKLSESAVNVLKTELEAKIHLTTQSIINYVEESFGVK